MSFAPIAIYFADTLAGIIIDHSPVSGYGKKALLAFYQVGESEMFAETVVN
jgi:hypothetical protein